MTPYRTRHPLVTALTSWLAMTSLLPPMTTSATTNCSGNEGATEHLRALLEGNCLDYKLSNLIFCSEISEVNCSEATELFVTAFAGLPPCNVTPSRFDTFLQVTRHSVTVDRSLFWEQTKAFVHHYSQRGARAVTLEDTLTGVVVDGITFCSSPGEEGGIGGEDTEFCPTLDQTDDCPWNAETAFWVSASSDFASKARGVVSVMLNGSVPEAFSENSYFGKWELPNLMTQVVTRADIWLVHFPGDVIRETCHSASIQRLQELLSDKEIPSTCSENPEDALWLLCWDRRDHPECQGLLTSGGAATTSVLSRSDISVLACLVFLYRVLL